MHEIWRTCSKEIERKAATYASARERLKKKFCSVA